MADWLLTDYGAVADGVTNCASAFPAVVNAIVTNGDTSPRIILPTGTIKVSSNATVVSRTTQFWLGGVTVPVTVLGSGMDETIIDASSLGTQWFWGNAAMADADTASALVYQVNRGDLTAQLLDVTQAGRFTVGRYVILSALDLQGIYESPYGYPPNNHYFEYLKITDITGDVITFQTAATQTYKATYPLANTGSAIHSASGGPAMLSVMGAAWDNTMLFQGFELTNTDNQTSSSIRYPTWNDVRFGGTHGSIPSSNDVITYVECDGSTCNMEVDKFVNEVVFDGGVWNHVKFQSSSTNLLTCRNGFEAIQDLTGTPKRAVIDGCTLGSDDTGFLSLGPSAYGTAERIDITNTDVPTELSFTASPFVEKGLANISTNTSDQVYVLADGVFTIPNGADVTNAVDNGSGKVRLTVTNPRNEVDSTAQFVTDQYYKVADVGGITGISSGTGAACRVTVIDADTLDLPDISFSGTYTTAGSVGCGQPPRWAVPNSYVRFSGTGFIFKVADVTQDEDNTYVTTDWTQFSGGYPTTGLNLTPRGPVIYGSGNTGDWDIVDYNFANAQGKPLGSYSNRTYRGWGSDPDQITIILSETGIPKPTHYGRLVSIKINVITPYTGSGALTFNLSRFGNWTVRPTTYTPTVSFAPAVNAKIAGERSLITATSLAWSGVQSGDTLATQATDIYFGGTSNSGPNLSSTVTGEASDLGPVINVEIITDQGVRQATVSPLRLRARRAP